MRFRNRTEAGLQLAERLLGLQAEDPVVVALPRGGVPVAAQVARALGAPLDVLVVRKLACAWQPELGFGAVGEDGVAIVNRPLVACLGLAPGEVEAVVRRERAELERRRGRYRAACPAQPVGGRTVILVDDGMATGSTARAAVEVLRARGARRVVVAVPVASGAVGRALGGVVDEVVALRAPVWFVAIGQFYDDFAQTTDQEVTRLLAAPRPPVLPVTVAWRWSPGVGRRKLPGKGGAPQGIAMGVTHEMSRAYNAPPAPARDGSSRPPGLRRRPDA